MRNTVWIWYTILVIFTSQVAVEEIVNFRDCSSDNVYNVDDQTSYTLKWSDGVENFKTFTCKFRGYKSEVCIKATKWDVKYKNTYSGYHGSQMEENDITLEYFTYSPIKNKRFGDGWHISSTKKTFYQRPWSDDQSTDPTETWCEGTKDESDEIVGVKLLVSPGSSKRRVVLNVTGKADNFALILGLSIGAVAVVTAIICVVVIYCFVRKERRRENIYRNEYRSRSMTADRATGRHVNSNNSNLIEGSEINRATPTPPLIAYTINGEVIDTPPPSYDNVMSEDRGTNPSPNGESLPPPYQSLSKDYGGSIIQTSV